jgi:hypothetical protein
MVERSKMRKKKYTIVIDDNFHFMDESESYKSGEFDTYEEALGECKKILDDFLEDAVRPGDTADQLYSAFVMFGETPHIHGEKLGKFSATNYARKRCTEIVKQQCSKDV